MILEQTQKIIEERQGEYGEIEKSFESVARAFNEIIGAAGLSGNFKQGLCGQDVALIQILLKLKRAQSSPKNMDHYVDVAGYAEIMARLA